MKRTDSEQSNSWVDWEQFQRWFEDSGTFASLPHAFLKHNNIDWLQDLVGQVVKQTVKEEAPEIVINSKEDADGEQAVKREERRVVSNLTTQIFETHGYIVVRIRIPKQAPLASIQVWMNAHHIRLEGMPGGAKQMIHLPKMVEADGARAVFRERTLEIRAPKAAQDDFRQIAIQRVK